MQLLQSERIKIINIISIAVCIFLIFILFLLPKIKEKALYSQQISRLRIKIEKLVQISHNTAMFEAEDTELHNKLEIIKKKLPFSAQIPYAISQISRQAKELGISITEIKPQQVFKPAENLMDLALNHYQ